jgi:hypothetical protein
VTAPGKIVINNYLRTLDTLTGIWYLSGMTNTDDTLTFEQFIVAASSYAIHSKDERLGQAYYNTLSWHRPDLAVQISNDPQYDPYFEDKNINRFLGFVATNW